MGEYSRGRIVLRLNSYMQVVVLNMPRAHLSFPIGHILLQPVNSSFLRDVVIHVWHFLSIGLINGAIQNRERWAHPCHEKDVMPRLWEQNQIRLLRIEQAGDTCHSILRVFLETTRISSIRNTGFPIFSRRPSFLKIVLCRFATNRWSIKLGICH